MNQGFVDEVKIYVKGGDGGNGCIAFHREKFIAKGGPSGGTGGRGGNIFLVADENLHTLNQFSRGVHFKAPHGEHGTGKNCTGHNANGITLHVPCGTLVTNPDTGEVLADLAWHGQVFLAARAGVGGRGNASFASHSYRLPRFAQKGEPGEERWLRLVLKMIAQVGIVGFPNAGKSTLLSKISRATPRIADYPFTTLVPNLGMVWLDDLHRAIFADIPGLIEGAHEGHGLGDRFLRHVERTRLLVHMVDASNLPEDDPLQPYRTIRNELEQYSKGLGRRPEVVALNKIDKEGMDELLPAILAAYREAGLDPITVSARDEQGLEALLEQVRAAYVASEQPLLEEASDGPTIEMAPFTPVAADLLDEQAGDLTPEDVVEVERGGTGLEGLLPARPRVRMTPAFTVRRENESFVVEGRGLERIVSMTDLDNDEAVRWLQRGLFRMGVEDALKHAGAVNGSPVVIRGFEFEFQDEVPLPQRPTRKQKRASVEHAKPARRKHDSAT